MGRQAIINLSSVRFIDSSALGVMVRARKLALEQGVELLFTGLCPAVQNVVQLARLEDFLLHN
jgi:anti-anti-sigma factor